MENKLKIKSVNITASAVMAAVTKPDRRFSVGYRKIGEKPQIRYTIDIIAHTSASSDRLLVGDTVHTIGLLNNTFRVISKNIMDITLKCVMIHLKDDMNLNIQDEISFIFAGRVHNESSSYTNPKI